MTIQPEIKATIEMNMEFMLNQTKAYLSFLKVAFPAAQDISELTFSIG